MQDGLKEVRILLTARDVQSILHVDRSTVYRMAEDGRLPAIRVGKQWRFPADLISALVSDDAGAGFAAPVPVADMGSGEAPRSALDPAAAQTAIDVAADLLGVMMVVTDMSGEPITAVTNPCPWFAAHSSDPQVVDACLTEWRDLAELDDFQPTFRPSAAGFECARAFIRSGSSLVGMVLAGGVRPADTTGEGLFDLDEEQRQRVLGALPRIAASLTRHGPTPTDDDKREKR